MASPIEIVADDRGSATGNRLFQNPGDDFGTGGFVNVTDAAGVADGGWGWAACFVDIDNDTDLDIYHTNGYDDDGVDHSRVFVSDGSGIFNERAADLGLDDSYDARGAVCAFLGARYARAGQLQPALPP